MTDKSKSAPAAKSASIKNPEQELEHPAPMPRDQQGQGVPKDHTGPVKQIHPHGNQERHGGGEGLTGMQPGAGHPRGR